MNTAEQLNFTKQCHYPVSTLLSLGPNLISLMSDEEIQKINQITYHIFTKLFLVVHQARSHAELPLLPLTGSSVDQWVSELVFLQLMPTEYL